MRGTTQKDIIRAFGNSKENPITVVSFDPDTRQRISTYGELNLLEAINEISYQLNKGKLVILTDSEGSNNIIRWEINFKTRISYKQALRQSKRFMYTV